MLRPFLILVVAAAALHDRAFVANAEEHTVRMGGIRGLSWVYADRTSTVAEPGKDGPGRLHIKVKNGDFVAFPDNSHIVFENGADEKGKAWEYVKVSGPEIKFIPLDAERKKYYANPDRALMTTADSPFKRIIIIEIKNLTGDRPILFASAEYTHTSTEKGRMSGAIVLDPEGAPIKVGAMETPQKVEPMPDEVIAKLWQSQWESLVLSLVQSAGPPDKNGAGVAFRTSRFQDDKGNTFGVEILHGLQQGDKMPSGFEPIIVGKLSLCLLRKDADKLRPTWVAKDQHPEFCTKVLVNRSAFPGFLAPR
jgi:hypothetical protein